MNWQAWTQIAAFAVVLTALVRPLGWYIARIADPKAVIWRPVATVERLAYRFARVDPAEEQGWIAYAVALLWFNLFGIVALYAVLRLQHLFAFNPQKFGALTPDLALNTAVSFVTNTSWQSYGGESTLGNFAQMAGITTQSFLSCATGVAVAFALIRGLARHGTQTVGNFWADVTRITLYLLLPVCILGTLFLVWKGVPQTLAPFVHAATLENAPQVLARGPVASQEMIKLLSGDGGGFFNANSAHPFENPTALTGLFEIFLMLAIGAALTNTFGRMMGDERQGWVLYAAMAALFLVGLWIIGEAEMAPMNLAHVAQNVSGNMEGKEVRFGIAQSSLFAEASTASSDGAVDSMHDSYRPLSGLVLMANMMLDEVIFGGPGSGLFGMLLFVVIAVFVAGLMIGRTPEYLATRSKAMK